jgi:outer membrane lipoprotein-sorting protein
MSRFASVLILSILCGGVLTADVQPSLGDEWAQLRTRIQQSGNQLKDMKATVEVVQSNRRELEKMGKSYAETYQIKTANVCFKAPDSFRIDGQLQLMKVTYITTGNTRMIKVPSIHLKKQEDISKEPLRQMSSLDLGIISGRTWDIYKVKLVRTENSDSGEVYVLQLLADGSKKSQQLWVSAADLRLLRRDRLMEDGSIGTKMIYSEYKQFGNLWIPTKAEVYNGDNKLAAVTQTKDIKVNGGVDDKEFE